MFCCSNVQFFNIIPYSLGLENKMYNLNERFKGLCTDVDMKPQRTCTGVGQSVHGYCDYYFLCLMTLFQLPAFLDRERSDSITKRFFCNTESSAVSWYRVFIYVEDLRCKYDKAGRITLSLAKCRRMNFLKFWASISQL